MSGPIIRKYGFANFEKIFGERELQHGVEGKPAPPPAPEPPADATKPSPERVPTKAETGPPKP